MFQNGWTGVYPAEETIEQINYNGKYKDGFWNAMISKKNVTQTTKGYNYLVYR